MSVERFDRITKFSPSVIYFFEPERSVAQLFLGSNMLADTFMYQYMQTQDLIYAYLYAQEIMLPEMIAHLNGTGLLSTDRFLTQVKELHRLSCQQMLSDKTLLGVYHTEPAFCWHYGALLNGEMLAYFSDLHEAKTAEKFSDYLNQYFKVPVILARNFIHLLETLKQDKTYESHPYFSALDTKIEARYFPGIYTLMKLNLAYHTPGKLSDADRDMIQSMVLPCLLPELLSFEMEKFASQLLNDIQHLNIEDKTGIADFLAAVFHQLTLIHPFVNGNGRVAICLLNLLLVAMKLPSIVIRTPGDTQNPKSDYVRAIMALTDSRAALSRLIESRLLEASETKIFNQAAYDLCCLRLNVMQALQALQAISYPIDNLFKLGHLPLFISASFCRGRSHQELEKIQLRELLAQAQQILKPKPLLSKFSLTSAAADDNKMIMMSEPFTQQDVEILKQFLQDLSGLANWKYSHKGGDCFWLTVDSLVKGQSMKHVLTTSIPSLQVKLSKIKGMEDYVIQCRGRDVSHYLGVLAKEDDNSRLHF